MLVFSTGDVVKITGVSRSKLQQWIESGFLEPSAQKASNQETSDHETRTLWNTTDLYTIAIFKKIVESGLTRGKVSEFLSKGILAEYKVEETYFVLWIREGDRMERAALLTNTGKVNLVHVAESLNMPDFDDAYIMNFHKLKKEVDDAIFKWGETREFDTP